MSVLITCNLTRAIGFSSKHILQRQRKWKNNLVARRSRTWRKRRTAKVRGVEPCIPEGWQMPSATSRLFSGTLKSNTRPSCQTLMVTTFSCSSRRPTTPSSLFSRAQEIGLGLRALRVELTPSLPRHILRHSYAPT